MAKKPKDDGEQQEQVKSSDVRKSITARKLKELLGSSRKTAEDVAEITGTFASEVKQAQDKHHLHRKAFRTIAMLDKMEPEKLAEFLDYFDHYLDISGLAERAEKATKNMEFGPGEGASDNSDESDGADKKPTGNVRKFPTPTSVAAE